MESMTNNFFATSYGGYIPNYDYKVTRFYVIFYYYFVGWSLIVKHNMYYKNCQFPVQWGVNRVATMTVRDTGGCWMIYPIKIEVTKCTVMSVWTCTCFVVSCVAIQHGLTTTKIIVLTWSVPHCTRNWHTRPLTGLLYRLTQLKRTNHELYILLISLWR